MKRTIGIIMLVIAGLNFLAILSKLAKGESVGSPMYIIILIMIFGGGISLVAASKKTNKESDIVKRDDT